MPGCEREVDAYAAGQWNRQIESDILAGCFDAVGKRAEAEFEAGRLAALHHVRVLVSHRLLPDGIRELADHIA